MLLRGIMLVTLQVTLIVHIIFSPNGKYLLFLSCKSAVDSGAHSATNSLHRLDWLTNGKLNSSATVCDVVCFLAMICSINMQSVPFCHVSESCCNSCHLVEVFPWELPSLQPASTPITYFIVILVADSHYHECRGGILSWALLHEPS